MLKLWKKNVAGLFQWREMVGVNLYYRESSPSTVKEFEWHSVVFILFYFIFLVIQIHLIQIHLIQKLLSIPSWFP